MFEDTSISLNPIHFFAISADCRYFAKGSTFKPTHYQLPSTSSLTGEEEFAKVAMGWNEEGVIVHIEVDQPASHSRYPEIEKGDSVELFFDTRDLKTSGFNTRFCHHFFFLPQKVEETEKGEKTHFRTEDSHPLTDPQLLEYEVQLKKKLYTMKIFIPSQCLYGYDPKQFDRLGFTYRINRAGDDPQHFSVVTQNYQVDQQPSLWGSIKLIQ